MRRWTGSTAVRQVDIQAVGIFIIHVGFPALCPNTASPVLEPAAVKHYDTPFPLRGRKEGK